MQQGELFTCTWHSWESTTARVSGMLLIHSLPVQQGIIQPQIRENSLDPIQMTEVGRGRGPACTQKLNERVLF